MFDKNNSNTSGQPLCPDCFFCHTYSVKDKECHCYCGRFHSFMKDVGVCNKFIER